MAGGWAKRSAAFSFKAAATRPDKCASLPVSSGKASKMPKVDFPRRIANHATVAGSCWTSERPPRRKSSTSVSFPGFASSRTHSPSFIASAMVSSLKSRLEFAYLDVLAVTNVTFLIDWNAFQLQGEGGGVSGSRIFAPILEGEDGVFPETGRTLPFGN